MSAPPYMKLYVGDYHGDTTHLNTLEHGAYLLLLMAMWRAGGKLPMVDAKLAKLAKLSPDQWAEIRAVILEFFTRRGGQIVHKRLTQEIAKYEDVSAKRKDASEKGVAEKRRRNSEVGQSNGTPKRDRLVAKPEPEPKPYSPKPPEGALIKIERWEGPSEVRAIVAVRLYDDADAILARSTWRELPDKALVTTSGAIFDKLKPCLMDLRKAGWALIHEKARAA